MSGISLYGYCRYGDSYGFNGYVFYFGQPFIQNSSFLFPAITNPESGFKLTQSSGNVEDERELNKGNLRPKISRRCSNQRKPIKKKFKEPESLDDDRTFTGSPKYGFRENGRKYLKKNTQSNISNQVFSFLSTRTKSAGVLERLASYIGVYSPDLVHTYYSYMVIIKNHKRKYLNKKFLLALVRQDNPYLVGEGTASPITQALPLKLFCKLTRMLIHHYLTKLCPLSIITSKKMDGETFLEHMHRRRQVYGFLLTQCEGNLTS